MIWARPRGNPASSRVFKHLADGMTDRDIQAAGQPGGGDTSGTGVGPQRPATGAVAGPACSAGDSLLVRLEARPRLSPGQITALAAVDVEFHAETRRIHVEYGLCEFDPNGSIIPSNDPLVRI